MNKGKIITFLSICVISAAIINGCVKDKGKEPAPAPTTTTGTTTGSTVSFCDTITFTKHIKPVTDQYCAIPGCHTSGTSNPPLTDYTLVKEKADAGRIKARVIDQNPSVMPPSTHPQLTTQQKQLITCWLENGKKQ